MTRPVWLAAVGDATDPRTFGGTPYHCLEAGRAAGLFAGGLRLRAAGPAWRRRRAVWSLRQLLRTGNRGGYQYSEAFLASLWRQAGVDCRDVALVNFFQLYPDAVFDAHGGERWFYIDQTLTQLFDYYGLGAIVPASVRLGAVARETRQYAAAAGVICQSAWAAAALTRDYGVPRDRVHVVLPGANLDAAAISAWAAAEAEAPPQRPSGPLRLVFVGKDWRRKGLDRLIRAVGIARLRGFAVELTVVGVAPSAVPPALARARGVTWAGSIDKRSGSAGFIERVAGCDVGCLLSTAEAGGISLREFGRLGLPTIAPATGGSPEYVVPDATHLVPPEAPDDAVADILARLAGDPDLLARQRAAAWRARRAAGWDRSVTALAGVLGQAA